MVSVFTKPSSAQLPDERTIVSGSVPLSAKVRVTPPITVVGTSPESPPIVDAAVPLPTALALAMAAASVSLAAEKVTVLESPCMSRAVPSVISALAVETATLTPSAAPTLIPLSLSLLVLVPFSGRPGRPALSSPESPVMKLNWLPVCSSASLASAAPSSGAFAPSALALAVAAASAIV